MMMGQNRSGMRISSVSSAGYVSSGGRSGGIYRSIGCPQLPTRTSVTFFMFLLSFGTNIYFYIENQELLHNLAYKELHEVVKIQECQKLMAQKGLQFNAQVLRHVMKGGKGSSLNGFIPDNRDPMGFDSDLDSRPLHVQAMPDPRHRNVPNVNVNPAPILTNDNFDANFDDFDTGDFGKYDDGDDQPIQAALDADARYDARYDEYRGKQQYSQYNNPRIHPNVEEAKYQTPPKLDAMPPPQAPIQAQFIPHESEEDKELIKKVNTELQDLLKVINDVGSQKFAEDLMQKNNPEMAEKIEYIEQFEGNDGQLDMDEIRSLDPEDIQQEINDIVEEADVQSIVQDEASEPVQEEFNDLANEIESDIAEEEIKEAYESDEGPAPPQIPNDPWYDGQSQDAEPADPFGETASDPFGEPAADPFGAPPANQFGEPAADPYGVPAADPFAEAALDPFASKTQTEYEAFGNPPPPESESEYSDDSNTSYESENLAPDSYGVVEPELEPAAVPDIGDSLEAPANTSEESLNLERPIGSQEYQSQRAENPQTGEVLNQEQQPIAVITTTSTTTTTASIAKDSFLPMMEREESWNQPPPLQPQQELQPPLEPSGDPLKPIVAIGGGLQNRVDGTEEDEPMRMQPNMNQGYGMNQFGMNQFGIVQPQQFGMQPNPYAMPNQAGMFGQQPGMYGQQQQQLQNQQMPTKDPDEVYPVPKKLISPLQPGEYPTDCNHLYNLGAKDNGVFYIKPRDVIKKVRCEFKYSGGWTIIQHRFDGSTEFYQNWENYKNGFGDVEREYWLGLETIHELTNRADSRIRIDLTDVQGHKTYVEHENFFVDDEMTGYKLKAGIKRHGDLGDSFQAQSGEKFSTYDRENDLWSGGNCAVDLHSGWWYSRCSYSNLNGRYYQNGKSCSSPGNCVKDGIYWAKFPVDYRPPDDAKPNVHLSSWYYSMTSVTMSVLVDPNKAK